MKKIITMCINALIIIFLAVAGIAGAASFLLELKRDLMMMQQNSYRNERYLSLIHI